MSNGLRIWIAAALGIAMLCAPASAQAPKVGGKYYEDKVDLGFKIKYPKGWNFIPGSPLDANMIGKYAPPNTQYIQIGKGTLLFQNVWLLKFDRRPDRNGGTKRQVGGETITITSKGSKDVHEWMGRSGGMDEGRNWEYDARKYPKPLKVSGVPAEYFIYTGLTTNGDRGAEAQRIHCFVAVFHLSDDQEVALVGVGPQVKKKWRAYESAFTKMAKSFKRIEVKKSDPPSGSSGPLSLRDQKRAELEKKVATTPGWKLYETDNYFLISSNDDREFMKELMERLEAIRKVYERDYPAEQARLIKKKAKEKEKEGEAKGEPPAGEDGDQQSVSAVNPMEASRTSVVRVCKNKTEYVSYGGPGGSAGYWNWVEQELVVFDDKARGGRANTWLVLNHEAFHQYIFYFYGNISPHSWYGEGTGDFYSGYKYDHKRFKLEEAAWRVRTIQQNIREGKYAPLKDFVRWTQSQYYGNNDLNLAGGDCYAQGWSLIWFLRTGPKKAKGWQDSWNSILDTYLATLATTGDLDEAVDKAFAGIDWDAFEESWKNYVK